MPIPSSHADLIDDKTRAYAYLATTMPDGSPQVTPVWFNADGDDILINTARRQGEGQEHEGTTEGLGVDRRPT